MGNSFDTKRVTVGKGTYGCITALFSNLNSKLLIGNYCSIAAEVVFIPESDHPTDLLSTYPWKAKYLGEMEAISRGDIIVDDDVWIGYRAIVLSGVHISQGAIVAAGSIVTKDVPPYAIVGGNPARLIRYRYPEEIIKKLLRVDYSQFDEDYILSHFDVLYSKPLEDGFAFDSLLMKP